MKSLIVNADDAGFSDEINEAVKKCLLAGAITGVSVMATGERFGQIAAILRDIKKTEVGAHLALTGGDFAKDYRSFLISSVSGKFDARAAYTELSGQIKKIKQEGLDITHLDSHEHIHMFPWVLGIVARLAREFEIPYVRLPVEGASVIKKSFSARDLLRFSALKMFASYSQGIVDRAAIRHNDFFLGHFHAGRIDDDILVYMVDILQDGVTELAVHPAVLTQSFVDKFPWYKNSQKELDALLGRRWKALAEVKGVRFVTHREVGAR